MDEDTVIYYTAQSPSHTKKVNGGDRILINNPSCSYHHEYHTVAQSTEAQVIIKRGSTELRKRKNKVIKVKEHNLYISPITRVIPQRIIHRTVATSTSHFAPPEPQLANDLNQQKPPTSNAAYTDKATRPFSNRSRNKPLDTTVNNNLPPITNTYKAK